MKCRIDYGKHLDHGEHFSIHVEAENQPESALLTATLKGRPVIKLASRGSWPSGQAPSGCYYLDRDASFSISPGPPPRPVFPCRCGQNCCPTCGPRRSSPS